MKLSDLLQELRENILHDRSDQIAGTSDQLWSDATLIRYINESQKRFARRGLVIRDGSTPSVTQVTLTAGQNIYELHPSILGILSAKQAGDPGDLTRSGHSGFDTWSPPETLAIFDPTALGQLPPGKPLAYSTDEQLSSDDDGRFSVVNLRLYPAPDAAHASSNILLRVVRMPLSDLAPDDLEAEPEIPDMHHLEMLDWAAYLALRMVDVDAEAPDRSEKFRLSFEGHVAEARQAVLRKMFVPQQWGFGRNGWSWSN